MTKEDELKLKELYESTFGRKPSGKAKIETIIDRDWETKLINIFYTKYFA